MRTVLFVALTLLAAAPHPAAAQEQREAAASSDVDSSESHARPEHLGLLAFRIVAGTSRAFPANTWLFGFGTQLELEVAGVFEIALGAAVLLGEASTVFPVDLLLKKTFAVGERAGFFVGLGPTMAVVVHETQHLQVAFGGTANAGITFWLEDELGILIEATYQLIVESGSPVHDIEGAVGAAWGF